MLHVAPQCLDTLLLQAGSQHVPMHQAKVLDRSERIAAVEAAIRKHCGAHLHSLVACASDLRSLLRVKVHGRVGRGGQIISALGAWVAKGGGGNAHVHLASCLSRWKMGMIF